MNEQLLKDFIATAQKYNYNWNKAFGLFPELKGYDQQVLKDYVATAEKFNYDYNVVNPKFPELGFGEPSKKKEPTVSESKLEKPTSGSSSRRFEGVTEEPISKKKVRTEDYLDQVQNIQKKPKTTTQKVESTFEQPKETKPPLKIDVLSEKEAMQMMAEDFGKKEFEAYSSIEKIPSANKLKDLDEQTTANILNKQFEGTNLEFKKLGWQLTVTSRIKDGISDTILNEKTIDLSDPNADKQLKSFVSNNLVKKSEREQFENAQSVEDLVELVGSNPNKFKASLLEGMDVEKYFERERQILNGEMARAGADTYDSDLKSYEQKVVKFNQDVKGGKMSKADFDARSNALETERKALMQRRDIMSSVIGKAEKIDSLTKNLEKANVITTAEREKQGSLTGLVLRGIGEGLTDVSQAMIDFGIAGVSAVSDAKTLADAITPGEYERLKRLGFSDDQIKNEIQKSVKNKANQVLRSVPDAFGIGTTEEYAKSADRGIIEQAAYALGESLGAVGGGVATAGTNAGFFAMSYNALEDQMRGPQFDALTENEKKIMSVPYGLVIGALEKLGAKVATGAAKNKTLGMFSNYIMAKTFSSLPKNASLLEIKSAIDKSVAASVANGMLKITGAGIVEGGTEFTQQIFEGIEKDVANRIIQSNQLETAKEEGGGTVSKEIYNQIVKNKFFKDAADLSTTEGIGQLLKESGNAFLVGAVAGGMGSGMSVGIVEPITNKISNNKFAVYRDIILNDDAREGAISSINKKVEDNQLTREEADEQIKSINESYPALRQIPSSFSLSSQREAFGLLREKDQLQKEIEGKDPALVAKQKDRIAEIETQLKGLSYAVQEQSTNAIPVQPTTGVGEEVEGGTPESKTEGTAGEVVGEETQIEQAKAKLTEEERQSAIDSFVETMRNGIEETYGDNENLQDAKKEVLAELEADPIAFAEARKNEKGPSADFLSKLSAAEEIPAAEAEAMIEVSEPTQVFEYTAETVPAQLQGIEPASTSEITTGRGKNKKTTTRITYSGQQLIDAGIGRMAGQQAPVAEAAVVAEAEPTAEPVATEAVIGDIEVTEVPAVEETMDEIDRLNNILTAEDFTKVNLSDKKTNKVAAQITKAAKAISKVLPKVKFVVHSTPEAFVEATKVLDGRASEGGIYDHNTKTIHINLKNANSRTVAHEVFHALILSKVASDAEASRLTRSMITSVIKSLKQAEGGADIISFLEDFESDYEANIQNEEKLSELFAILSDNYKKLPPATKNIIIRFLERMAKLVGIKPMTSGEVIQFMNVLSAKVEAGEVISEKEIGKQQQTGQTKTRKQIIGEKGAERLDAMESNTRRMSNLVMAKNMTYDGKSPLEIRVATNWELGDDGKWRYETVDNIPFFNDVVNKVIDLIDTKLNQYPLLGISDKAIVSEKASDIVPSELTKMYPELNDYTIDFGIGNENKGSIDVDNKKIRVNVGANPKNTVSVLLHEVQHAIQQIEGFDSGANMDSLFKEFVDKEKSLSNRIKRLKSADDNQFLLDKAINDYREFVANFGIENNGKKILNAFNLYNRKSGEVEARNVQERMNMTEEERRNTLLSETAEVKKPQQIFSENMFQPRKQKIKTTIDEFDGETTVTLDGKKIGKMYYDRSQRTWVNAEFDKRNLKPYSFESIYGDILGETKAEAINELIRRNSEVKAETKVEEPKKVTQYTDDQIINEFLTELSGKENIQRSPIGKEFIYGDKAFLEFSRFDKETGAREISIQSIASIDKGQGIGKAVMKDITDTADELGITLTLDAKPFGDTGLSKKALINFYEKNGFVPNLEEAFGGEFETEEELIDYVLEEEREALPMVREPKQEFAPRKQKNSVDRLVNEGKEQGKTDQEIRQDATAAGFTQKEISSALAKYYAKEEGIFTRSGKTGVTTRLVEGAKKLAQQYATAKGLMPKIGFNLKERMEGEISKEANRAVNTAKKFGKLFNKYKGDKEVLLKGFDRYIRGEKRVQLPAKFVGIANEMRNHIDTLSQMLINNGAVTGEMADTIKQNLGSYLSRSYEIYDNKNWKKKVGDQLVNQARNFLKTQPGTIAQAQADAAAQNIPFNEALDNLVDNKIEDLFAEVQTEGFFKGSKVGSKDLSTLKFRQDIPEQIRMLMGEYTDPAMNYARTVNKLIHLAAQHKFLSDMREAGLGKFFFEKNDSLRPIGYNTQIAAKGSEVMAPLNGLYTTPEIFEAFQKQFNQKEIGAVMTFLYRVMGITKWLKTIASAATHMKNVFSNIGFVMANGHNILKLGPAIKVVANDLRTMSKPEVQAKIDEYIEAGIMRQGAGINEIRDMFKDANLDRFLEKRLSLKQPKSLMSKVKRAIGAPFIGFKNIAEALYQAEDDMFKIAAYENEVARYANSWYNKKPADLTEAERKIVVDKAADNVKNTYPTYSRIPEGIKQLRKFPLFIGSFISFQAESYRTAFNTIALAKEELLSGNKKLRTIGASRIAGASAYLTIKNAILSHFGMALGTGLSGVIGALYDDDDEKKKEEDVREFLPPWSKDSDIIPIKKSDGTIEYIDFSASDPHGALNKALNAFFRGDDLLDGFSKGLLATVEPFVGPDITVGLAMQLANNENDFGGPIYNEQDTFAEKTKKITDFVYKVIEPGTITSVRKVLKDEQPLMNSLFGEATGMKIRPLEVKKQFEFKMDTYADDFAEIKRIYNSEYNKTLRMMEDPKVTKKELEEQKKITEEAFNRANALYAAKGKELMNLINAANRLGVDYDQLIEAAKAKSVMNQTNLLEIQQGYPAKIEEKPY